MKTIVVNTNRSEHHIYIGRKNAVPYHFGNPFKIGPDGYRTEVIEKFKFWIYGIAYTNIQSERRKWVRNNLESLRGKRLGCHCAPLPCHGDVYVKMLEEEGGEKDDQGEEAK